MAVLFEKTKYLTDKQFHYCPGCNHGIIHRLVAEVIDEPSDELNLDGKVVGVAPVGCSVFAYDYFNCDMYEAAHGRAPAVATGIKRLVGWDTLVFTYQATATWSIGRPAETFTPPTAARRSPPSLSTTPSMA